MPFELGVWRIDQGVQDVEFKRLDLENRLEDILAARIDIASPNWMVIGQQVQTSFDKRIDLLAIDGDGNLVILELKRDKTYRDIVAQTLDYGSWVRGLDAARIGEIYHSYCERYPSNENPESFDKAFRKCFDVREMPEELNESHELVIVASALDASTERVVCYLREYHDVHINAVFFRVFRDDDHEYLSRVWLTDPTIVVPPTPDPRNDFYVSYNAGEEPGKRSWEDAVKFGYISGGGKSFYSRTLDLLQPGARLWVNVPGRGYVGVGIVQAEQKVRADEFLVPDPKDGRGKIPIHKLERHTDRNLDDPEKAEYYVGVKWLKTVPLEEAYKEKGFFGNQNTVARPRVPKWNYTVERLSRHFGIAKSDA